MLRKQEFKPHDLVTKRLKLRTIDSSDATFLIQLWTDPQVRKHLGGILDRKKAKERVNEFVHKKGYFCITKREDGSRIGICSLDTYRTGDIEISYQFTPESWGKGFGIEAITAVLAWGFSNLKVNRIIAVTQKENTKSRNLLEKIGMSPIDEFIEFNEPQIMYAITPRG